MYSSFQLAKKYLRYYFSAYNGRGHGMHSPFVFDFILSVLQNKHNYEPPAAIEQKRRSLLQDKTLLEIEDLGAGSRKNPFQKRAVAELAKNALKPPKYATLLYRLARHYKPGMIVELGTSLGITTAYFSNAVPEARITTIEGSAAIAAKAEENFRALQCNNIELLRGNFDNLFPEVLTAYSSIDILYIDGNHRYEPTVRYFQQALPKMHNNSIIIFDDIHWSEEMEKAWNEIRQHPSVTCSIDIFFLGFIFFRSEIKIPQHFAIRK